MTRRTMIASCGMYLPDRVLTNAELAKTVDTSDEWIVQRTGIRERRIAAEGQPTSDLAVRAARQALEQGGYAPSDIDAIIVATSTPDTTFPSVAVRVQSALGVNTLGMPQIPAFDVQAVCSGFVYGLTVADSMILSGKARRILLIGAEKMSSILDWNDRTTCVLFGDGAGAVVLEATDEDDRGILSTHIFADGALADILRTTGGPSTTGDSGFIYMEGREVFRHAVNYMADVVHKVVEHNNLKEGDIKWLVPHQANIRIIEATAKKLNMPMEQVVVTVDRHGNTSAASIPLALCEAVTDGRIKRGDLVLFEALGAGLTWGAVLARM